MQDTQGTMIVPIEHKHLAQVEKWASRQAATNLLLKTSVVSDRHRPDNYGWAALQNDEVLAIATVKLNQEHVGYLNCIVKPASKRQGIGTMIIEYVLEQPPIKDLVHLHAAIETSNTAARQVLNEHGFTLVGNDADGYLEFAKHKHY